MSDNLPMILLAIVVVAIGLWFVLKPGKSESAKVEAPAEPKSDIATKAAETPAALVAEPEKVVAAPPPTPAPATKAKAATKPKSAGTAPAKPKAEAKAKPPAPEQPKPSAKAKTSAKAAAPAATVAKAPKAEPKAKVAAKAAAPKTAVSAKAAAPAKAAAKTSAKAAAKPAAKAAPKPAAKAKGPDNLLWIKGLGPKLNTMFIDNGVTSFAQIAGWSESDIAAMDAKLGNFAGRIARDNFVEQAALLAKGDIASFEAKYGKLDSEN